MSMSRRSLLVYGGPLALLLLVVVWGVVFANRLQSEAERLAETGKGAMQLLSRYRAGVQGNATDQIAACYDEEYASTADGPWVEQLRYESDGVQVYDWETDGERSFGKAQVVAQMSNYLGTVATLSESKFKLDLVEEITGPDKAVIRSFLWLRGTRASGEAFESQMMFRMWIQSAGGEWKIHRQEVIDGHTVTGDRTGFTNITAEAGIDVATTLNPAWDEEGWIPERFGLVRYATGGIATADYDEDGWYDLFIVNGPAFHLYRNIGGTFVDVTAPAGLPPNMPSASSGLFADFDGDGDKDLFVSRMTKSSLMYRNDGDGTFTDVSDIADLGHHFVAGATVGDFDNDGRLDLYLGRYLDPRHDLPNTLMYTRNSQGNSLLRNLGDFQFEDVTEQAGVRDGGLTLGIAWADYDMDGHQDLYLANDFGRNTLFRNRGDGTFADVSHESGTLDIAYGMSTSFADIDNDGDLDLYVSNVRSASRWYGQAATLLQYLITSVRQGTITEDFGLYSEMFAVLGLNWASIGDKVTRGNSLFINDGEGGFTDISQEAGTNPFGWYWASTVFDYDNDGYQDIYAANGWITAKSQDDL
ncbi:MAG: hypothetical protein CME13_10240 [Gemmatimonadetes bacterium]|nr:hypothetical protein [Gemmatimonadota bacterium]